MDRLESARMDGLLLYKYKALIEDNIRVIRLQPGDHEEDLCAEIAHIALALPPASLQDDFTSTRTIDKTLPAGWQSFRTPEGRLFYQNPQDHETGCQYDHPSPESIPHWLSSILKQQSWDEDTELETERERRFEALSYAWGDPSSQDVLYVNDWHESTASGKILVTKNLSSALRHLRQKVEVRTLWVDAICINQNDSTEKSRQVMRIPDIYRSARRVIAWLGETSFDSDLALKTLEYLGKQIEISQSYSRHLPPHATERGWLNQQTKLPYSQQRWEAVTSLMQRPWFDRLWVLQELAFAKQNAIAQCGHSFVAFTLFRRAMVGLRRRFGAPDVLLDRIEGKGILSFGLQACGMSELLFIARDHSCSVPHDKIFGLLGFISPKIRDKVEPSYRKSFAQIYKEIFLAHSSSMGRLELLAHCNLDAKFEPPSWVPDWRGHYYGAPVNTAAVTLATGMSKANFREMQPGELLCTVVIHGAVTSVRKRLESNSAHLTGSWLRELIERCSTSLIYPNGEDISSALERLLCMDHLRERHPETLSYPRLEQWRNTLRVLCSLETPTRTTDGELHDFRTKQRAFWRWGKFFETEHGYLGWGPLGLDAGDELCFVLGLYCPLVIRLSGNDKFKVVGSAHLHGLMDGEAVLGQLPDDWTVQQYNFGRRSMPRYHNTITGEITMEDPRLGPLDPHWQRFDRELTADDPEHADLFVNTHTGEEINYDPRLTKEALEQRGVPLQDIIVV